MLLAVYPQPPLVWGFEQPHCTSSTGRRLGAPKNECPGDPMLLGALLALRALVLAPRGQSQVPGLPSLPLLSALPARSDAA